MTISTNSEYELQLLNTNYEWFAAARPLDLGAAKRKADKYVANGYEFVRVVECMTNDVVYEPKKWH